MKEHIVDNPPEPDFLDYNTPGDNVCINYPDCTNRVSEKNAMCSRCLQEARRREKRVREKWDSNEDGVRREYDTWVQYREQQIEAHRV